MKAVIMAGGKGSRLRPLTCTKPKPMVFLANKPVMTHTIELLKKYNIFDIAVTTQHMADQIMDFYDNGKKHGVLLRYFLENTPLGTAGSVKNAQDFLDETFLVISGDGLTDIDLSKAIEFHKQKKSLATLVLTSVDNPLEYGIVVTNESGEIIRFFEKPSWGEVFSDQVNTGIYILEPEVLKYIPEKKFFDFSKDLFPLLMEKGISLYGFNGLGYWCDIGNSQAYLQAHQDILLNKVSILLTYEEYASGIWVGKNTEIHPAAQLTAPVVIGNNCFIGSQAKIGSHSFLGNNCLVFDQASIKRSVLWNGVTVGRGTEIRGAVLCNNVHVKEAASVYEGAIIGEETIVYPNCTIKPGAKIWPSKTIEEGTVFKNNLVWGIKYARKLFGFNGIQGQLNIDLYLDQILHIGSAFGSLNNSPGNIAISYDVEPIAHTIKQVLSSGLQVVGQKVFDLGELTTPMSRFAIRNGDFSGGIHVYYSPQTQFIHLIFLDEQGANISKNIEKKMETLLSINDFKYVPATRLEKIKTVLRVKDIYLQKLQREIPNNLNLKIYYHCPTQNIQETIVGIFKDTECQLIQSAETNFADEVIINQADLGFCIDSQGESLVLYDEKGEVLEDVHLQVLLAYLIFEEIKGSALVVPVDAPEALEDLAKKYQGKIIRTKSVLQARMKNMLKLGDLGAKQFDLEFDGLQALVEIIKILHKRKLRLSQLRAELPRFYLYKEAVECPWEIKGRIIRSLIEKYNEDSDTDFLEGIKFRHPKGWTLVLPDAEKPLVKIVSEGSTMEVAQEITGHYKEKIIEIINK